MKNVQPEHQHVQTAIIQDTPVLSRPVAERIIERVSAGLNLAVSVADSTARVLASTDRHLVGERSLAAAALLAGATPDEGDAGKLLSHADRRAKSALAERLLAPLAHEPELLTTLAAFLRVDLAPSLAARELSIHRHTLSYRLDKITALTGLDPRRFRDAAQLHVAMLLQRVEMFEPRPATKP